MNYTQPQPSYGQPQQPHHMVNQEQYQQPVQESSPQQAVPVVNPNTATFIADVEVLSIIGSVHPELASAMINLSIKKFAENPDFASYFVKAEFKKQAEIKTAEIQEQKAPQDQTPTQSSGADFSSW